MFEALVARVRYHIQKANFMGLKEAESTLLLAEAAEGVVYDRVYTESEKPDKELSAQLKKAGYKLTEKGE